MTFTTLTMPHTSLELHSTPRQHEPALLDLWWYEHFRDAMDRTQSAVDLEAVRHSIWRSFGRGRSAVLNRSALGHLREALLRRQERLRRRDEDDRLRRD